MRRSSSYGSHGVSNRVQYGRVFLEMQVKAGNTESTHTNGAKVALRSCKIKNLGDVIREVMDSVAWRDVVLPNSKVVIKPNLCTKRKELITAANTSENVVYE